MSETLRLVVDLIQRGEVRVSAHGYDELAADGIPKGETSPAVLVIAYRPDPARWSGDFLWRRA